MAAKYRETDYMYASARVRAMEGSLAGSERLAHLCDMRSAEEVLAALGEHGFESLSEEGRVLSREEILLGGLRRGYEEIDRMGGAEVTACLRYPYDCNNIKALIKCFSRNTSPEGLTFDGLGTIPLERIKTAFADKRYGVFPPHMAEAIPEAEREFSATGNPQKVDLILDRACYEDMLGAAEASGVSYARELVAAKIDLTNLLSCVRLIRMKLRAAGEAFLSEVLLTGGVLDRDLLTEALAGGGETMLSERLAYTPYSALCPYLLEDIPLHVLEREADDLRMELARGAKFRPFGAELLVGYAMALEYEVMNIRIILAGKDAGLSSDVIRERLRKSYV